MMFALKNFMALAVLVLMTAAFATSTVSAQSTPSNAEVIFNAEDPSAWHVEELGNNLADGRHTLATFKKNRTKIIVVIKGGRIAEIGQLPQGGAYKVLTPSSAPCFTIKCPNFAPPRCYTIMGQCVCVCSGSWLTLQN